MAPTLQPVGAMKPIARCAFALVLAALGTSACASPAGTEDDASGTADAVTVSEAVPDGANAILLDERASAAATKELGVTSWHVYFVNDVAHELEGVMVLGTGSDAQVRYAMIMAASKESTAQGQASVAFVRYDNDGPAADQQLSAAVREGLQAEASRLGERVQNQATSSGVRAQSRLDNGLGCAAGITAGLLLVGSIPAGIVWVSSLGLVTGAVTVTDIALTAAATAVIVPAATIGGAKLAGFDPKLLPQLGVALWGGTKLAVEATGHACKAAVTGR
ncbi:MAG: hypothetical protein JWO86_7142 [Myxococcaceae bacterium]|nr:hypothetical protein [Myxococcaceae bacterium]